MKEFTFMQVNARMNIRGVCRIIGKYIFFMFNNTQYGNQVLEQMRKKGAIIELSSDNKWMRIDIFGDHEIVKLGDIEFNIKEKTEEEIEQILYDFYIKKYKEAKFIIEEK